MKPIATIERTKAILDQYHLSAKKKFGQNFLIEPMMIQRIVESAHLTKESHVIEIGPGIGALSEGLLNATKHVTAYEIDQDMVNILHDQLPELNVVHTDFLKVNLKQLPDDCHVVANLPYYITSKLLTKLALEATQVHDIVVMVQSDVADKLVDLDQLENRLPLTLLLNEIGEVNILFDVPRQCFMPSPHVDSTIIQVKIKDTTLNRKLYFGFLRTIFAQRRKTLRNNLKGVALKQPIEVIYEEMGLDLGVRAENLSMEQLRTLFSYMQVGEE